MIESKEWKVGDESFAIDQSRKFKFFACKVNRHLEKERGRRWVQERKTEQLVIRLELMKKTIY